MAVDETCEEREGILEIHPDGYGFIRVRNCEHSEKDVYVSAIKIRKAGLRQGDMIKGIVKVAYDNKPAALLIINTVNGVPAEELRKRPRFDDLVPIYPDERLKLENARSKNDFAIREIDLIAPIGKGQRGMIVSPPKAGKTTLLKKIANSISENYPDVTLMVLLIDERPEEVTDMQRSIKGEVVYSTFDEMPEHHTKAAELLLSRAKRLVENGKDVVILMDSLTRLARAYNLTIPPTGRTLSGVSIPARCIARNRFSEAREISKTAEALPLSQPLSSIPEAVWTTSFTRSSRARAIWKSTLTENCPKRGFSPQSILTAAAREEKTCCCRRTSWKACGQCVKFCRRAIRNRRLKTCCKCLSKLRPTRSLSSNLNCKCALSTRKDILSAEPA